MLGNLKDFDPTKDCVNYDDLNKTDKYIMVKLNEFVKDVKKAYEEYSFADVYKLINNFVSTTLSSFYFDFTKDILYIEKVDSKERRCVQTVIYNVINDLVRLIAPILPYTSEEVYSYMKGNKEKSVHLLDMPEVVEYADADELNALFKEFFALQDEVNRAISYARDESKIIGSSQEAEVKVNSAKYPLVKSNLAPNLHQLLVVSKVEFTDEVSDVEVVKSSGVKCTRCWNYVDHLEEGEVCARCKEILK